MNDMGVMIARGRKHISSRGSIFLAYQSIIGLVILTLLSLLTLLVTYLKAFQNNLGSRIQFISYWGLPSG